MRTYLSLDFLDRKAFQPQEAEHPELVSRPNILIIVADDLGYTDLGVFGSEITTPNLDALAREGTIFTNFYVSPNCSPTRAMLLSGTDSHLAGLGNMSELIAQNQQGQPGYEGHLSFRVASLAELLGDAGYHTYMTGKWHLGLEETTSPAARGFEKSFALLDGGAGHFDMTPQVGPGKAKYRENGKLLDSLPRNFYSTKFYAEKMIEYIDSSIKDKRPFFGYLAFTAVHFPLQAPPASIAKYSGKYNEGYEVLHSRRLSQLKKLGLIPENLESSYSRALDEPAWDELSNEQKSRESRVMEIYAAMIDDLDVYTGKVINYLKNIGEFDNTFIVFLSDNGAEGHRFDVLNNWVNECCDNDYENMGAANSYLWYGPNWAGASVGPWRMYKGFTSEGGIRAPAFVHYPKLAGGKVNASFITVMDVMPTLLEVARVKHPGTQYRGKQVLPMKGQSMLPVLQGITETVHEPDYVMGWELFGKKAIRQGNWKLLQEPAQIDFWKKRNPVLQPYDWQLFNLENDPSELTDVSGQNPEKLKEMIMLWDHYQQENEIIIPNQVNGY